MRSHLRTPRPLLALVAALLALAAGLVLGSGLGAVAAPSSERAPADRPVIVEVEGDAANGFGIHYSDGSALFPPTDSEMLAECSEYDTRIARVKCRVKDRTWYRDLGDLQRSLAWVRQHG